MVRIACSLSSRLMAALSGAAAPLVPLVPLNPRHQWTCPRRRCCDRLSVAHVRLWLAVGGFGLGIWRVRLLACASWKQLSPLQKASARSSRCSTSFQSMKRQPAARCCKLSAFSAAVCTTESGNCRSTDVLESRLTRSKLDSVSRKNSAKCLATSWRIELMKARTYVRSTGWVCSVKFRWT